MFRMVVVVGVYEIRSDSMAFIKNDKAIQLGDTVMTTKKNICK